MADLYNKEILLNMAGETPQKEGLPNGMSTGNEEADKYLNSLPPEEREAAFKRLTAPLTGKDIAVRMENPDYIPNRQEYALWTKHKATQERSIMEDIANGAGMVFDQMGRAVQSASDHPLSFLVKAGPSVLEALFQGTRGMYGMVMQSQDPNSVFFQFADAINGRDSDDGYNQFLKARNFNKDSVDYALGKKTMLVDKKYIDHEFTQMMSYIADPTLFVPFGKVAGLGLHAVGMGEKAGMIAARVAAIKGRVLGGAIKYVAGKPIEFIGGATRGVIDYGLETSGRAFETATGISGKEFAQTARMSGIGTSAASLAGYGVPVVSDVSNAYIAGSAAKGIGEAISSLGTQIQRGPRGILSYAKQALLADEAVLSPHAKGVLRLINGVDPLFSFSADIVDGATTGVVVGGGLGYLSAGEEGLGHGIGAGVALGSVGGLAGRIFANLTGGTTNMRADITAKYAIEGNRQLGRFGTARAYELFRQVGQIVGMKPQMDGIVAALDSYVPDAEYVFRDNKGHDKFLDDNGFDKETGVHKSDPTIDKELSRYEFRNMQGAVVEYASDGRVVMHINTSRLKDGGFRGTTIPHEIFHLVVRKAVMSPHFIENLKHDLLGVRDPNGKLLERGSVEADEAKAFFKEYSYRTYGRGKNALSKDAIDSAIDAAVDEYNRTGQSTFVEDAINPNKPLLEHLSEEFGAYYFENLVKEKPADWLFFGGKYEGVRGVLDRATTRYMDFWEHKVKREYPKFDFRAGKPLGESFTRDGKRIRVSSIDNLMTDFLTMTQNANRNGRVDISLMSDKARSALILNKGLDDLVSGKGKRDIKEREKALRLRGKDMYKVLSALNQAGSAGGLSLDGNGDFVGRINDTQLDALVRTGHMSTAMAHKIRTIQNLVTSGDRKRVVDFGYWGRSMQIETGPNPARVYDEDVPFTQRSALILDLRTKIGKDGRVSFMAKTLDAKVIQARGDNLWADPEVRSLWNGSRNMMDADLAKYLENAGADPINRVESSVLLEYGDGLGGKRRDVLHQYAGIAKTAGDVYFNTPISEINADILNSYTNFSVGLMQDIRVRDSGADIPDAGTMANLVSRNFTPEEIPYQDTPSGRIYTHRSGYQFHEDGQGKTKAYDYDGELLGTYDNVKTAMLVGKQKFQKQVQALRQLGEEIRVKTENGVNFSPREEFIAKRISEEINADPKRKSKAITYVRLLIEQEKVVLNHSESLGDQVDPRHLNGIKQRISGLEEILRKIKEGENIADENFKELWRRSVTPSTISYAGQNWTNYLGGDTGNFIAKRIKDLDTDFTNIGGLDPSYFRPDNAILGSESAIGKDLFFNQKSIEKFGKEWDDMYPMTFRSQLVERIEQIVKSKPNITVQQLRKQLLKYGSITGERIWAEAHAIGLLDYLGEQIKPTYALIRRINPDTGVPFQRPTKEVWHQLKGETQPKVDLEALKKFIDEAQIKVRIDEGGKEFKNVRDTQHYTYAGDRAGYIEVAVRINDKYAHGYEGHYGKDSLVHHRGTIRFDNEGNKYHYIEEVQVQNKDQRQDVVGNLEPEAKALLKRISTDARQFREDLAKAVQKLNLPKDFSDYILGARQNRELNPFLFESWNKERTKNNLPIINHSSGSYGLSSEGLLDLLNRYNLHKAVDDYEKRVGRPLTEAETINISNVVISNFQRGIIRSLQDTLLSLSSHTSSSSNRHRVYDLFNLVNSGVFSTNSAQIIGNLFGLQKNLFTSDYHYGANYSDVLKEPEFRRVIQDEVVKIIGKEGFENLLEVSDIFYGDAKSGSANLVPVAPFDFRLTWKGKPAISRYISYNPKLQSLFEKLSSPERKTRIQGEIEMLNILKESLSEENLWKNYRLRDIQSTHKLLQNAIGSQEDKNGGLVYELYRIPEGNFDPDYVDTTVAPELVSRENAIDFAKDRFSQREQYWKDNPEIVKQLKESIKQTKGVLDFYFDQRIKLLEKELNSSDSVRSSNPEILRLRKRQSQEAIMYHYWKKNLPAIVDKIIEKQNFFKERQKELLGKVEDIPTLGDYLPSVEKIAKEEKAIYASLIDYAISLLDSRYAETYTENLKSYTDDRMGVVDLFGEETLNSIERSIKHLKNFLEGKIDIDTEEGIRQTKRALSDFLEEAYTRRILTGKGTLTIFGNNNISIHKRITKNTENQYRIENQYIAKTEYSAEDFQFFFLDDTSPFLDEHAWSNTISQLYGENKGIKAINDIISGKGARELPLSQFPETTRLALISILRQNVKNGLTTFSLTHPDDAPSVSNMKTGPRNTLYGNDIPAMWDAFLRKYKIKGERINPSQLFKGSEDASVRVLTDELGVAADAVAEGNKTIFDMFNQGLLPPDANWMEVGQFLGQSLHTIYFEKTSSNIRIVNVEGFNKDYAGLQLKFKKFLRDAELAKDNQRIDIFKATLKALDAKKNEVDVYGYYLDALKAKNPDLPVERIATLSALSRAIHWRITPELRNDVLSGKIITNFSPDDPNGGGGSRKIPRDSDEFRNRFIGKYARENPFVDENLNIVVNTYTANEAFKRGLERGRNLMGGTLKNVLTIDLYDKNNERYRRYSESLQGKTRLSDRTGGGNVGSFMIYLVEKNGKTMAVDPSVKVEKDYRGRGYQHIFYSEAAERVRSMGATDFFQRIENEKGLPLKSQVKTFGFEDSSLLDIPSRKALPATQENFDTLKNPPYRIVDQTGRVIDSGIGSEPWVFAYSRIHGDRSYSPDDVFGARGRTEFDKDRIDRLLDENTGVSAEKFLSLTRTLIVKDNVRLKTLNDLIRRYNTLRLNKAVNDEEVIDVFDNITNSLNDKISEDAYNQSSTNDELVDYVGRLIINIKELGSQIENLTAVQKDAIRSSNDPYRELVSQLAELRSGGRTAEDRNIRAAIEEDAALTSNAELPPVFKSQLYQKDIDPITFRESKPEGALADILRRENKLVTRTDPDTGGEREIAVGEVNGQRIINELLRIGGGRNKAYAEAKAIGLLDWIQQKSGGLRGQKKIPTSELIKFIDENQLGLVIDPQLVQNADFGDTSKHIDGGIEQSKQGYRVFVVRMANAKHTHPVKGHFNNAVVHIRTSLRTTEDGRKVLHIEEIQANNTAEGILTDKQKEILKNKIQRADNITTDLLKEFYKKELKDNYLVRPDMNNWFKQNSKRGNYSEAEKNVYYLKQYEGMVDSGFAKEFVAAMKGAKGPESQNLAMAFARAVFGDETISRSTHIDPNTLIRTFQMDARSALGRFRQFKDGNAGSLFYQDGSLIFPSVDELYALMVGFRVSTDKNPAFYEVLAKTKEPFAKQLQYYLNHTHRLMHMKEAWRTNKEMASSFVGDLGSNEAAVMHRLSTPTEWMRLRSELNTKINKVKSEHPLQEMKEWVKVAFRTILRAAETEGVSRITITPWDKTPIAVGMEPDSAKSLYGDTIIKLFNSELARMNSHLTIENKTGEKMNVKYRDAKLATNSSLQKLAIKGTTLLLNDAGVDVRPLYEIMHMDDSDLTQLLANKELQFVGKPTENFARIQRLKNYFDEVSERARLKSEEVDNPVAYRDIKEALRNRLDQYNVHLEADMFDKNEAYPSGLMPREKILKSARDRYDTSTQSRALVDQSYGFDMSPEIRKVARGSQPILRPDEGRIEYTEQITPAAKVLQTVAGYSIMIQNNKFRVYNPNRILVGIYKSEQEAKKKVEALTNARQ